ncbi:hypothetical protein [Streptomyces sp. NPDC058735]|uniref:hypothetical protein n=1 Tax=unclassified Streptomyces TaxID=2593676 RepID=UPI0036796503
MVETSDISINCAGASLVAIGGLHLIEARLEEAHWTRPPRLRAHLASDDNENPV